MTGHEEHNVANPERTQVDSDVIEESVVDEPTEDHNRPRGDRRDPHDQPWPEVANEVKRAVEDADGPLDRGGRGPAGR
jgi:hypothetical protein